MESLEQIESVEWKEQESLGEPIKWEKKGQQVMGILQRAREVETQNGKQFLYLIETKNGLAGVWESAGLSQILPGVKPGTPIRIIFQGKKQTQSGRKMNDFSVFLPKGYKLDFGTLIG